MTLQKQIKEKRAEYQSVIDAYNKKNSDKLSKQMSKLHNQLGDLLCKGAKNMKIETEDRGVTYTQTYIKFKGFEHRADDLLGLIDALQECDGFMERVTISDSKLAKKLEEMEVISRNARGSYNKGHIFYPFREKVCKAVHGKDWRKYVS